MSIRPSVRTKKKSFGPGDGILWNLIFEELSKIYREISSFIKTLQDWRVHYSTDLATLESYVTTYPKPIDTSHTTSTNQSRPSHVGALRNYLPKTDRSLPHD